VKGRFLLYSPPKATTPTPEVTLVSSGIYDDLDPEIVYRGGWTHDREFPQTYAHSVTYSNVPGSEALFRFRGDVASVITQNRPSMIT
jgi:hypothetical protein